MSTTSTSRPDRRVRYTIATPRTVRSTMQPAWRLPAGATWRLPGIQPGSALIDLSAALTLLRTLAGSWVRALSAVRLR